MTAIPAFIEAPWKALTSNGEFAYWSNEVPILERKHEMRNVGNKNTKETKTTTPDLEVFGNPDIFRLIAKASSETEGWMRSTKAMHIPHIGVVLHVSQLDNGQISDALEFIPGAGLVEREDGTFQIVAMTPAFSPFDDIPFGAPVPPPAPKDDPMMDIAKKFLERIAGKIERDEERAVKRMKREEGRQSRAARWASRRSVHHYELLSEWYERRTELLTKVEEHRLESGELSETSAAALDAADYLLKAIEEEKRLFAENKEIDEEIDEETDED